MKSRLVVTALGLFVVVGFAHAQSTPQSTQPTAAENTSAQAGSQPGAGMESYGGKPDTKMQSGARHATLCRADPQCNIFFGGS
jgi:hypothetical protein